MRKIHSAEVQITHLGTHPGEEVRPGKKPLSSIKAEKTLRDPDLLLVPTLPDPKKASSPALGS